MKKWILKSVMLLGGVAPIIATISCDNNTGLNFDPTKKDSAIMVVGAAGHKDKGFLQGAYDGAQKALKTIEKFKKYGEIKIPSSSIPNAKEGTKKALQAGAYTVLGVGYQYPTFFNKGDYAGKYPKRQFIAMDGSIKGDLKKNVTAISYKAEQGSFLTGLESGLYLAKHFNEYKSDGLKVGAFGGAPFPAVKNMIVGYIQGIAYYNDNLAIDEAHKVKFIGWNGAKNGFTNGFVPDSVSTTKSKTLLSKKADIVFPVAGGQVNSMVDAIKGISNSKTKIVGVDADQNKVFGSDGKYFITSSLKDTKTTTIEALKAIYRMPSKIKLGHNNSMGIDGRFVSIAEGVFNSDDYKGKEFSEILKKDQNIVDISKDAKNIYNQLLLPSGKMYKYALLASKDWSKAEEIFGSKTDLVPSLSNFK